MPADVRKLVRSHGVGEEGIMQGGKIGYNDLKRKGKGR